MNNQEILKQLNWRYATKKFDTSKELSQEDQDLILEALRLAPSSFGIQPWKFINVKDKATRLKIQEQAWGQPQIVDASMLLILTHNATFKTEFVNELLADNAASKGIDVEVLKPYKEMIMGFAEGMNDEQFQNWSAKQVYIALGQAVTVAAMKGLDACPMEGFSKEGVDEILGLKELNLKSAVVLTIGYRTEDDVNAKIPKFRFSKEKVVITK